MLHNIHSLVLLWPSMILAIFPTKQEPGPDLITISTEKVKPMGGVTSRVTGKACSRIRLELLYADSPPVKCAFHAYTL